jgi:hypothetical protein
MACSIDLIVTGSSLMLSVQAASHGAGTDAAGEFGEVVGRMQDLERLAPAAAVNEVVPVGNDVVHRAARLAEGDAAVHAARALAAHLLVGERAHELLVDLDAFADRLVGPVGALDFEEAGDLSHRDS